MTFGLQEAKDLSQVVDALGQRGLLAGNLGVYGISYGATTAIHLAAADRRVRAVVAVEPSAPPARRFRTSPAWWRRAWAC